MTIPDLIHWLFLDAPVSIERVEKARREAARNAIVWADVIAQMSDDQLQAVTDAQ